MKTFIISMETPIGRQRYARLSEECEREGLQFERIEGVHGKSLKGSDLHKYATPTCATICTPGMVGCGASHIGLWQRIVEEQIPMALILEDDAELVPGFAEKLAAVIHTGVPGGWDVILAGCFVCSRWFQLDLQNEEEDLSSPVRPISMFGGTHAYLVSLEGAAHLLHHAPRVSWHIDRQMASVPGLRLFACKETLAIQHNMNDSNLAEAVSFPSIINTLLGYIKDGNNITFSYYANVPIIRLGTYSHHVVVTPWLVVCFLLGWTFGAKVPLAYVGAFVALDMAIIPPTALSDVAGKLGAYGLGVAISSSQKRRT